MLYHILPFGCCVGCPVSLKVGSACCFNFVGFLYTAHVFFSSLTLELSSRVHGHRALSNSRMSERLTCVCVW